MPDAAPASLAYRIEPDGVTLEVRSVSADADWDTLVGVMKEKHITGIRAGCMTDIGMDRLSYLAAIKRINTDGARQLTDVGLAHLARMPQLEELDLSGYHSQITDRGLDVLRHLPHLRQFKACWPQRITDAGVANLAQCDHLENVNLLGTPTGDGAIKALAGKPALCNLKTGKLVSDAGLALLHQFPAFKTPQSAKPQFGLMSFESEPNHLLLDGPFTDKGFASLAGLDGLSGLSFFWHTSALTPHGLSALSTLPNLAFLGCQDKLCNDVAMQIIGGLPGLRMLMGQGSVAGDEGWAALSRSKTIEYIWGRDCPNFSGPGFASLAAMESLRGLAVSCKKVDDAGLSSLPRFPALKALMPMDVSDDGFRHVGRCEQLEDLWCMYCRDTGDVAAEHLVNLPKLKTYYAGVTQITDKGLESLGKISSLEKIEFHHCAKLTNAGLVFLRGLPHLREIKVDGSPAVTREGFVGFPASVRVDFFG